MNSTLFGLILYLVLIASVATWTWGKNRTKEDFILGGRRLGAWALYAVSVRRLITLRSGFLQTPPRKDALAVG